VIEGTARDLARLDDVFYCRTDIAARRKDASCRINDLLPRIRVARTRGRLAVSPRRGHGVTKVCCSDAFVERHSHPSSEHQRGDGSNSPPILVRCCAKVVVEPTVLK